MATGMLRATTNSAKSFEPRNPKSRGCPSKARGTALFLCAKAAHGSAQAYGIPRSTFRYRVERYGKTDPHVLALRISHSPYSSRWQALICTPISDAASCWVSSHSLQHRHIPVGRENWNFFGFVLYYGEKSKIPNAGAKNFPLTYYYNRQGAKWPGMEPGQQKSSKSFSDLLLSLAAPVGG